MLLVRQFFNNLDFFILAVFFFFVGMQFVKPLSKVHVLTLLDLPDKQLFGGRFYSHIVKTLLTAFVYHF